MKRSILALVLILVGSAAIAGCSSNASSTEDSAAAATENEPAVRIEAVQKHSMGEPREQVAEVIASSRVDITAEAGGLLVKLVKNNGEQVKAGEVIALLDNKNAFIEQEKAEAALKSAEMSLVNSKVELTARRLELTNNVDKLKDLLKQQTKDGDDTGKEETTKSLQVALKQLEALQGDEATAALEAQVETSRLMLEQAQTSWGNGEIKAPASGVLTDVKVDPGTSIQAGSLFGIVQNADKVKIKAQLTEPAAQLARNKRELAFKLSTGEASQKKAKVIYLSEVADASTRLYALELEVDNSDGHLKPASRVRLQLTTPEEENVVAIPSLSVVREGTETFVFVLNGNKAEKKQVKLGRINGPYQEALEGVEVGDSLIVSGQHALDQGQTVKVEHKK